MADAPASIGEVAAHAGISVGTVSNVLNRPDIVAEPTRHTRIAFVGGPLSIRQVADRREGALRALDRAGGPARTSCI